MWAVELLFFLPNGNPSTDSLGAPHALLRIDRSVPSLVSYQHNTNIDMCSCLCSSDMAYMQPSS